MTVARPTRLALLATLVAGALLAGCGGDGGEEDAAPPEAVPQLSLPGLTEDQRAAVQEFTECLREHGVESPLEGSLPGGPTPEMLEAMQACRDELPGDFELRGPGGAPPQ